MSLKSHAPIRRLHHGSRFALRAHQATIILILCVRSLSIALTPSRTMPYRARCRHRHRCHTSGPSTLHRAAEEARHEKRAPVQRATSLQIPSDDSPAIDPERADLKQITTVSSSDAGLRPQASRCLPPAVALSLTSLSLSPSLSTSFSVFFFPLVFSFSKKKVTRKNPLILIFSLLMGYFEYIKFIFDDILYFLFMTFSHHTNS